MRFWRFCWEILRRGRSLGIKRSSPFSKAAKTGFWWILPKQVLVNFVRTGFCEFCQNRFRRIFSNQVSDNGHFGDDHLFPLRNQQDGKEQMRSVLKKVSWSLYTCNQIGKLSLDNIQTWNHLLDIFGPKKQNVHWSTKGVIKPIWARTPCQLWNPLGWWLACPWGRQMGWNWLVSNLEFCESKSFYPYIQKVKVPWV